MTVNLHLHLHLLLHGPDVSWGNCTGCPLVVQYCAYLHGFRCYVNTAPNAKCQRVLVLAVCLVMIMVMIIICKYRRQN